MYGRLSTPFTFNTGGASDTKFSNAITSARLSAAQWSQILRSHSIFSINIFCIIRRQIAIHLRSHHLFIKVYGFLACLNAFSQDEQHAERKYVFQIISTKSSVRYFNLSNFITLPRAWQRNWRFIKKHRSKKFNFWLSNEYLLKKNFSSHTKYLHNSILSPYW